MSTPEGSIGDFIGDDRRFVRVDQIAAFSTLPDETLVQLKGSSVWTSLTVPGDRFVDLLHSMHAEDDEVKSPPEESMSDPDDPRLDEVLKSLKDKTEECQLLTKVGNDAIREYRELRKRMSEVSDERYKALNDLSQMRAERDVAFSNGQQAATDYSLEWLIKERDYLANKLDTLESDLAESKEEAGKRGRDRDWYNEQGIRLREKLQTLEKEVELLREKVKSDLSRDAFKQMEQMRNDQYERAERLRKRVRVLENDIDVLKEQVKSDTRKLVNNEAEFENVNTNLKTEFDNLKLQYDLLTRDGQVTQAFLRSARADKDEIQTRLGVVNRKLENTRQNARAEREKFKSDMAELVKERDRIGRDSQNWLDLFNKEIRKNTAVLSLLHEFDQKTKKRIWPSNEDVRSMVEEIRRAL